MPGIRLRAIGPRTARQRQRQAISQPPPAVPAAVAAPALPGRAGVHDWPIALSEKNAARMGGEDRSP